MKKELLIILGNQLFPINKLKTIGCENIFMAEDIGLCTYIKHHKQKIAFFLTAMRDYRDELSANQYNVFYQEIDNKYKKLTYIEKLDKVIHEQDINEVKFYEIADKLFRNELLNYLEICMGRIIQESIDKNRLLVQGKNLLKKVLQYLTLAFEYLEISGNPKNTKKKAANLEAQSIRVMHLILEFL